MKLVIDVENTVTKRDGRLYLDPYEPTNKLVMVGCLDDNGNETIYTMEDGFVGIQDELDKATVLIGHNITYDLMWLWECGFKYNGVIFDTMLAERILTTGDDRARRALDFLTYKYCKKEMDKTIRGNIHREGLSTRVIKYAADDVKYLHEIQRKQMVQINSKGLSRTMSLLYVHLSCCF